ncbi:Scr1 family TA system antitoxin-like transcriptional regulator [Glycomyces sp. MUSA5-2]|uniref:Scr1 family TA system antitoxin-like transcriptional regulator n=1 Tax=Glycomyces sp. MUSA5-2 TaxID=2053002 RepID=UPI003008721E
MADSRLAKWYITAELTALRAILGLSEAGLARALGVSAATIRNWESGKTVPLRSVAKDIGQMAGVEQSRIDFLCFVIDNYKVPGLVANLHTRNVRMIEQAERTYGYMFKYESTFIPGPSQLDGYQHEVLRQPGSEEQKRKQERGRTLRARTDAKVDMLIEYNALRHLRGMTHWDRQIEALIKDSERPDWEIRVIDGAHPAARGSFDFYKPDGLPQAGPAFVYTESLDQSRYIEDSSSLANVLDWYDQLRNEVWNLGRPIKEIFDGGIQLLA